MAEKAWLPMNEMDRIMAFIETNVQIDLEDWQQSYIKQFWDGYIPGAKLSMRFYRRLGYKYVWETDTTIGFLEALREGSRSHLALREMRYYRQKMEEAS